MKEHLFGYAVILGVTAAAALLIAGVPSGLAAVAAGTGCQDYDEYEFSEIFTADLSGIDTLYLQIHNGRIEVQTWGGDQLEIEVNEKIRARDYAEAQMMSEGIKLEGYVSGSALRVSRDRDRFRHLLNNGRSYLGSCTVRIPDRLRLEFKTHNGAIEIPRMGSSVEVETHNGRITIGSCRGSAELKTHNGDIEAGLVDGRLGATTHNGSVEVRFDGAMSGDTKVTTHNGPVVLRIDPAGSFTLTADTHSGRISCSLPGFDGQYNREHTYLRGTNAGGQYRVDLETHNGSITIEPN